MNRLELLELCQKRAALISERDSLTQGLEMPENVTANPMALMSMAPRLPDIMNAYKLSGEIEIISNSIIQEFSRRMAEGLENGD